MVYGTLKGTDCAMIEYFDFNFPNCKLSCKSTSGMCHLLGNSLVSRHIKKQFVSYYPQNLSLCTCNLDEITVKTLRYQFMIIFVLDEYIIFCLNLKCFLYLINFLYVETQIRASVKKFCFNSNGEYMSLEFQKYL